MDGVVVTGESVLGDVVSDGFVTGELVLGDVASDDEAPGRLVSCDECPCDECPCDEALCDFEWRSSPDGIFGRFLLFC